MKNLKIQVHKSIQEISPEVWDKVAAGRGFQTHRWYSFGEHVMQDCPPTYLIAWDGDTPIASASLFKIKNEPLPLPKVARDFMSSVLERRPLLVCRSPLADTSALILPGEPVRDDALAALSQAAQNEFKKQRCSFLVFDFLLTEQLNYASWPASFEPITVSEPGTYMPIIWDSFDGYLEERNNEDRQHYIDSIKKAKENGFILSKRKTVSDVDTAMKLIDNVSVWRGSAPNPWTRSMLENFSMIDGSWLEIHKEEKLVGCGAVLRDNKFQIATALGLEDDVPDGYFLLLHTALQDAFEHKVRLVRFGSGTYDIKHRMGFHLEDTNHAMISTASMMSRTMKRLSSE